MRRDLEAAGIGVPSDLREAHGLEVEGQRDGYVVLRKSTLAWLLERHRAAPDGPDVPASVAMDLCENVVDVMAPKPAEDRLQTLGPIMSVDQHRELLENQMSGKLPTDQQARQFWYLVTEIVHNMLENEGQAALQILGGER